MRGRRAAIGLAVIGVLIGGAAGWLAWKSHVDEQSLGRGYFYARAANEALARSATAATPALFSQSLPPLPGFETAPREVPCARSADDLRASGTGACYHFGVGLVSREQYPAICRLTPCAFIGGVDADWRNPATRAALQSLKFDRTAPCRAARTEARADWRRSMGDLAGDCTGLRWLKGPVFLAVLEASAPPDGAPLQMRQPSYRFIRLL